MQILSVDPSINYTGIAVWKNRTLLHYELLQPKTKSDDYIEKSYSIFSQVKLIVNKYRIDIMIIEVPDHFGVAGYMARESGSVQKLSFVCGMLISLKEKIKVIHKLPREWKSQLPKEVVYKRLNKLKFYQFDFLKLNNNIADAIAIGHSYIYKKV